MSETEPAGENMSFFTAASKDSERTEERRSSPRETLKRYVVLVFFWPRQLGQAHQHERKRNGV